MPIGLKRESWREYQGIAIADKEQNSRELLVYCPELLPYVKGEISAVNHDNVVNTHGAGGQDSRTIATKNYLTCTYRNDDTNFANPPDIRKGEQVTVYNYGDSNRYYWKSEGRNDNLRRCETRRLSISGSLENKAEQNDDNTYFIEMDTLRHKYIKISTSGVQGEKHRYLIMIDVDKSMIILNDEKGNQISIESEIPRVSMKNHENSLIDLNIKDIVIACKGNITLKTETGDISIFSGKEFNTISKANTTLKAAHISMQHS